MPNTFTDAQSGWYKPAVDFAQASGLMNGMTATKFAPTMTTIRAMVAQVLYRLADEPDVSGLNGRIADVAPEVRGGTRPRLWAYNPASSWL